MPKRNPPPDDAKPPSRAPRAAGPKAATGSQAAGVELRGLDALAQKGGILDGLDAPTGGTMAQVAAALAPGASRAHREAAAVLLLSEAYPVAYVARILDVSRSSLWNWRQDNPAFDELWEEAVTLGVDDWHDWQLRRRIVRSDTTAIIVGQKKRRLFVEEKGGPAVQVNVGSDRPMAGLTREELDAIIGVWEAQKLAALPAPAAAAGEPDPGARSPVPS